MNKNALIICSFGGSILTFRGKVIERFQVLGYKVHICVPYQEEHISFHDQIREMGIELHFIKLENSGLKFFPDIKYIYSVFKLCRKIRPQHVFSYTIKPVIFGTIAARLSGIKNTHLLITGLGYSFYANGFFNKLLRAIIVFLYRFTTSLSKTIFFQNPDNMNVFRSSGALSSNIKVGLVNGSGVDLNFFRDCPIQNYNKFLFVGRLLEDKGIIDFIDAAKIIKKEYPNSEFHIVGWVDELYKKSITHKQLQTWIDSGLIIFHGFQKDIRPFLIDCYCLIHPSYHEGTPRAVLEAMSTGRPIITTDAPGCRETIVDNENGFLVPVKSPNEIAIAIRKLMDSNNLGDIMGYTSRQIALNKYSDIKVVDKMFSMMEI
jgi:glycosyltransferase involved in cell wall biosynthesis|tara:strand:+ start:2781 stop:3905 length:1125 start_codon:yes stop_codon:yes gene_type:complete